MMCVCRWHFYFRKTKWVGGSASFPVSHIIGLQREREREKIFLSFPAFISSWTHRIDRRHRLTHAHTCSRTWSATSTYIYEFNGKQLFTIFINVWHIYTCRFECLVVYKAGGRQRHSIKTKTVVYVSLFNTVFFL